MAGELVNNKCRWYVIDLATKSILSLLGITSHCTRLDYVSICSDKGPLSPYFLAAALSLTNTRALAVHIILKSKINDHKNKTNSVPAAIKLCV